MKVEKHTAYRGPEPTLTIPTSSYNNTLSGKTMITKHSRLYGSGYRTFRQSKMQNDSRTSQA